MKNIIDRIYNLYFDNKELINKVLIILGVAILFGVLSSFLLKPKENKPSYSGNQNQVSETVQIVLFGEREININQGEKYIEPGFYAYTNLGEIKTDSVVVTNLVNIDKPGTYIITYTLKDKKVSRKVNVLEKKEVGNLFLSLEGNSLIVLELGEKYVEPGFYANDSIDGDITNNVFITGSVDETKIGTYTIKYSITNSTGEIKELERKVIVNEAPLDVEITFSDEDYTNNNIILTINVSGSNFYYVRYPDNTVSSNRVSTYEVTKNGNYKFYIYDDKGNYITKNVVVNNIDKVNPSGTCNARIEDGKTYINVYANDAGSGINNYSFYGNNNLLSNSSNNSYVISNKLKSVYVLVYDKAKNQTRLDCQIENQYDLEVHYINVGREDAILIRDSEKTIFIDGGSYSKRKTITPYLKDLGVTHIDVMIGSHLHYNHIQAQADLLENFTVDKIYYPQDLNTCYNNYCDANDQKYILDAIKKYNKKISIMKVNDNINFGDINIFCLGPIKFQTKSQNKYRQNYNSLNFILTYGNTKFMFTGDHMQSSNILNSFDNSILNIDVLKYPHHGQESIGNKIIQAMTPSYTIITNSSDGLSGRSEKGYLENVGSKLYYSYKDGNILVISDGKNISVKTNIVASDYKR